VGARQRVVSRHGKVLGHARVYAFGIVSERGCLSMENLASDVDDAAEGVVDALSALFSLSRNNAPSGRLTLPCKRLGWVSSR
jgi:hypothetical protein